MNFNQKDLNNPDYLIAEFTFKDNDAAYKLLYLPSSDDQNEISETVDDIYFDVHLAPGQFVLIDNESNSPVTELGESFNGHKFDAGDVLQRIIQEKTLSNDNHFDVTFANTHFGNFFGGSIEYFKKDFVMINDEKYPLKLPTTDGVVEDLGFINKDFAFYSYEDNMMVLDKDKEILTNYEFFAEQVFNEVAENLEKGKENLLYVSEDMEYNLNETIKELREQEEVI